MPSSDSEHQAFPITISSSVADDAWHSQKGPFAFESWSFDGLSDDGSQAIVISFHDNYPFSPHYFHSLNRDHKAGDHLHPAVSLVYSIDGKPVLSAVNEFSADGFSMVGDGIHCSIGRSSFKVESADYGTGYVLRVELLSSRRRVIKAEFEWLSIESDLLRHEEGASAAPCGWNIVSPRSDVSGRITITEQGGEVRKVVHFRGTGCHDHLRSLRPLDEAMLSRCWGRAHFVDSTAVFQCLRLQDGRHVGRIFLIDGKTVREIDAQTSSGGNMFSRFGLKVPRQLNFYADDGVRMEIRPEGVIESGFCEVKLVGRMRLICGDEKMHETVGIMAVLQPGRLRRRLVRQLSSLRIGTDRRPPLF